MRAINKLVFLGFILIGLTTERGLAQQTPDFRNIRWGYTPKQVRDSETAKPFAVKREKITYRPLILAGRRVGLDYEFNGDSLLSASYFYYTTASITKDSVMATAVDFDALLTEKYGRGKAKAVGDVRNKIWLTPRTQINLSVGNVDRGWSLEVQYLCRVCDPAHARSVPSDKTEFKPLKNIKDF